MNREKQRHTLSEKFNNLVRAHSLALNIVLAFIALISITVIILSIVYYQYNMADLKELSINNTSTILSEVNYSIDSYIDNMKSMGEVVVENPDVRQLLAFYSRHQLSYLSEEEEIQLDTIKQRASYHMRVVANTRAEITNIAIVPKYGEPVLSDSQKTVNPYAQYTLTDWFLKPLAHQDSVYVSGSHVQNLIDGEYRWVISISKAVTDPKTGEVTGVMLIDLNYEAIEKILKNAQLGKGSYLFLLDRKGNIIYHPQQQLVYSGMKTEPTEKVLTLKDGQILQKGNNIYLRSESDTTGWNAIGMISASDLISNKKQMNFFYILVATSALLISAFVSVLISNAVTRPLRELQKDMDRVTTGDLSVRSDIQSRNEVGRLSNSFNIMVSQLQHLINKAISDEKEKRDMEIHALQAQINPHFLYNTLDTIIWMSAGGKNEEVMEVTSALADLFRTSISQGNSFVPISTEIENIKNYLVIQKMRYKDHLTYTIEIAQGVTELYTPKLVLQPIVENAVYHGIKLTQHGGEILIKVFVRGNDIIYQVRDSGVGMSTQVLDTLFNNKEVHSDRGIGIQNVNNRLQLLFGKKYGLSYYLPPDGGTLAEIRIPIVKEEDEYDA